MPAISRITGRNVTANDGNAYTGNNEIVGTRSASDIFRGKNEAGPTTPGRTTSGTFKDSGFGGSDGLITPGKPYTDFVLFDKHPIGNLLPDAGDSTCNYHGFTGQDNDDISLEITDIGARCRVGASGGDYDQVNHGLQQAYQNLVTDVDAIYQVADDPNTQSFYDHTADGASFTNSVTTWASTNHRFESLLYRTEYPVYPIRLLEVPQPSKRQRRAHRVARTL